jgi:hypothetical protein
MNTAQFLHDAAMEFYDLARIAKAKGKPDVYDDYLRKAYTLDKEAALKKQSDLEDRFWKHVYARSAGWLAFQLGNFEEARLFAAIGLAGKPPAHEKTQLQELVKMLPEKPLPKVADFPTDSVFISGILASANLDEGEIKIRENGKKKYRTISVPKDFIQNIGRFYLGEMVEIEASPLENNQSTLRQIRRAA